MELIAVALLPNAGIGNKLFVWARCTAFAQLNGLSAAVIGWSYPKIGPVLRHERREVFYGRQLNAPALPYRVRALLKSFFMDREHEPAIQRLNIRRGTAYVSTQIPHWSDFLVALVL